MAAPETVTTLDLTGNYVMNKSLSDSTDKMLELQGVSWLTRTAISIATITLGITHFKDDDGVEHIDINQTLTGGIQGTRESRILDWTFRQHEDHIFGALRARSRRIKVEDIEVPYLQKDWSPDTLNHGAIQAYAQSETSGRAWNVLQVWGFETIRGERRHTRHLKFKGPKDEDLEIRLVYDFAGV